MACKTCRKGRRRRSRGISGMFGRVNIERIAAVGAGAAVAKLVNKPLNSVPFIQQQLSSAKGKYVKMGISAAKVAAGIYAQQQKSGMIQDAGLGLAAVGALELVDQVAPGLGLHGIGSTDDMEYVGSTIDINLSEISGSRFDDDLENYQAVAGYDDALEEEQALAGYYEEEAY